MSLMDVIVVAGKTGVILLDYFLRPAPPPPPIDYRDLWLATLGFGVVATYALGLALVRPLIHRLGAEMCHISA